MASPEKACPGGQGAASRGGTSDARSVALPEPPRVRRPARRRRHRVPQCTRNPRTARRLLAASLAGVLERRLLDVDAAAGPLDALLSPHAPGADPKDEA